MSSIPQQLPISLRAWPAKDDKSIPLSTLIKRIESERGSFRSVTEESLLDEVRREEAGLDALNNDGASENGDAEEEPDRVKEVFKSREEILMQLEQAHMASMVTLDFVSLLLSKDTPVQASLSISPALREAVSLGTLGVDKVQDSRVSKIQKEEIKVIAKGWKLQSLNEAVDSILASATRLEKEIENETKYWEQVLTVTDEGWTVCRLPQEKHTLGVRFGFAESAPAFRNRSLGALRRNADGSIYLDQGIIDATPKRVRVRIQTDGITTGEIPILKISTDSESVKSLILTARNTIFEEELWQELNREARALANQGVHLNGDELVCPITSTKQIVLDLQTINAEETSILSHEYRIDNGHAEIISLALHLLLSYAHRQNLHRRSQPPPPISNRPSPNLPYNLLRPIIAGIHHETVVSTLINLLMPLSQVLKCTGATDSTYTCTTTTTFSALAARRQLTASPPPQPEVIIDALVSNLSAEFNLPLTTSTKHSENQSLNIRLRTALFPLESCFLLQPTGPFAASCKPPTHPSFVEDVKGYILWATACALASTLTNLDAAIPAHDADPASEQPEDAIEGQLIIPEGLRWWQRTHNPTVLRKICQDEKDGKEITFNVSVIPGQENAQYQHPKQQIQISVTYMYVTGAADESAEAIIHRMDSGDTAEGTDHANEKGVVKKVWRSADSDLNEGGDDKEMGGQGERSKTLSLRDFIESVGRLDGPVGAEGELGILQGDK